jgi:CPA1 family monovalent cation:H+ antiporter
MNVLEYVGLLLGLTAAFAYVNHFVLRLPRNSGLLVLGLAAAVLLRAVEIGFPHAGLRPALANAFPVTNFSGLLLNVFLAFLLFASAVDADVQQLRQRKWTILALATVGVLLSTLGMAAGMYVIFRFAGIDMPVSYCLVFGALISPTDPVTVADVLRRLGVPPGLQAIISGESLFNDGVGIALFTVFLAMATGSDAHLDAVDALTTFVREAGGGALLGAFAGGLAFAAMRGIDEYNIELMISLTLVTLTYGVAQRLGVSGPVAVVVAGLIMGSIGVRYAVSERTRDYLHKFWSLTDELLNALLFLLIGLQLAVIELRWSFLVAAALAIPLSLLVRAVSIISPSLPLNLYAPAKSRAVALLTWSGLRGGISVALALSLPVSPYRGALVTACYGVVIFTMVVQGLSLERIAARLYPSRPAAKPVSMEE